MATLDQLAGREFRIRLHPEHFGSEHRNEVLAPHDGKTCKLVSYVRASLYVTDLAVPTPREGTWW